MINKNEQLSRLGEGLNAMGQYLQLSLEMSKRDRRRNLAIILYSHVLWLFQSILREVEARRFADAYARLPDLIDSSFAAAAVVRNPAAADYFFEKNDLQQIYRRKSHQTLPRDIGSKIKYLSGQYFAQQAGMVEYFSAFHRLLRHTEKAEGFRDNYPYDRTAVDTVQLNPLLPACESMFLATREVADFFHILNLDKEYYEYWQSFSELFGPEQAA